MRHAWPIILLLLTGCKSDVVTLPATRGGEYFEEVRYPVETGGHECMTAGVGDGQLDNEPPLSISPYAPSVPKLPLVKRNVVVKRWFKQGENPSDDSKLHISPGGEVSVVTGSSRPNEAVIAPPPDYTKYAALAAGFGMICWGIYALAIGWERIGTRFVIYGSGAVLLALTVESHGAMYSLALIAIALYVAYEKYKAYNKGLTDNTPTNGK